MKIYTKKTLSLVASALLLSACGSQESSETAKKDQVEEVGKVEVVIGTAAPLTGPQSHIGKDLENGVRLAIETLNSSPMLVGQKEVVFSLIAEDDQADPKQGTIVAQSMVDKGVNAIVGHLNSGTTIPASRIYSDAGIPQITPSSTNPDYTRQGFETTFRLVADDVRQGAALADYAVNELGVKTVAIVDDKTQYGEGLAREFKKSIEALGAEVVSVEHTTDKSVEFSTVLTNIRSKNPDLLFFGGIDSQGAPMLQQMRKLGLTAKFMSGDGCSTPTFIKNAGEAAEGAYTSLVGFPVQEMPEGKEFLARFEEKFGNELVLYGAYAYDATMLIADAIGRAQSVESADILKALHDSEYKEGVTSNMISFDEKGDLVGGVVTIYKAEGPEWKALKSIAGSVEAPKE